MKLFGKGNWGLRILALVLAIVIYHTLKTESANSGRHSRNNDRHFFQNN